MNVEFFVCKFKNFMTLLITRLPRFYLKRKKGQILRAPFFVAQRSIWTRSSRYYLTEIKETEVHFSLGKSISAIFFGSFPSDHLAFLWKLVSLILCFPFSHIYEPFDLRPYPCFSRAHSLMPLLFWQRNDWRGQAYFSELQPFRALPLSFTPYPRRSLFGIQQVSSSNVAHFLSQNIHTHTHQPDSLSRFFHLLR